LIEENWQKYNQAQDELEELGYDSYTQQQREDMEEMCCYLTGFIQTKLKEREFSGSLESNVISEPAMKVKLHNNLSRCSVAIYKTGSPLKILFYDW
jgi:hypothetical protein